MKLRSVMRIVPTVLLLLSAMGCGAQAPGLPPLQPASGTLTIGGKAIAGALVQFRPVKDDPNLTVNGITDQQGQFQLSTLSAQGNLKQPGAPEGTYTVMIIPPQDEEQRGLAPVELTQKYTVKPGQNQFTLEAPAKESQFPTAPAK